MFTEKKIEMVAYRFAATSHEVRTVVIDQEPYFVAKDVCDILGLTNSRKAISSLDDDERADVTISYTSSNGVTQNRKVKAVTESGLYALIMRSNKPEAKAFRKWVTQEVLPAIRKQGYYKGFRPVINDFIDARDIPFNHVIVNNYAVRMIVIDDVMWFNVNDVVASFGSTTSSSQIAKKLNAKENLAQKIWLFGNTHPAWFTTEQGVNLILSGRRKFITMQAKGLQLNLPLNQNEEGGAL